MCASTYLVFGDLHGRVLPAFKLAQAWSREHGVALAGLLQVGDLGDEPDSGRSDKATKRRAGRDSLESGTRLVAEPSDETSRSGPLAGDATICAAVMLSCDISNRPSAAISHTLV